MLRKICFGISLILSIAMCIAFLSFPIMKFDQKSIENHNQVFIDEYIEKFSAEASEEELEQEAINYIIDSTNANLKIHGNVGEFIQNENGEWIYQGIDDELREQELTRIRTTGIKYRDLANGVKNQFTYDINLYKSLKNDINASNKEKSSVFFQTWINPFPFTAIVLLISLEFASAFLVIIRSIKGMLGKKKTKLLSISVFGCLVSVFLLILSTLSSKGMTQDMQLNDYIGVFVASIKGSILVYYSFFVFLVCAVMGILTKMLKSE